MTLLRTDPRPSTPPLNGALGLRQRGGGAFSENAPAPIPQHNERDIISEKGITKDRNLFERGLAKRRQVLGDSYVDRALDNLDDFNRDFQRLAAEYCWGEVWGDETLSPRERSILTLGMVAAIGKMGEFSNHVRGAVTNGLSQNDLRAVLTQITIYCGIAVGADCFVLTKAILDEGATK